jgi:hypothetical protein
MLLDLSSFITNFEAKVKCLTHLILREVFPALIMGVFKCEYMKKLGGFVRMSISIKTD